MVFLTSVVGINSCYCQEVVAPDKFDEEHSLSIFEVYALRVYKSHFYFMIFSKH
jgi:hypothetical protein